MSETILVEIKRKMERFFIPNITIEWDEGFKGYIIKPHIHTIDEMIRLNYTTADGVPGADIAGEAWLKRYSGGIKSKFGKFIPASHLEEVLKSIGACGLCYTIIDKPEKKE